MHDYFKPDAKKAADNKQGRRLKKRKSTIANESIDLDRGKPSKSHRHAADHTTRGLAPKPNKGISTSSTSVAAAKTSTVAVSVPPTKNKCANHAVNDAMAKAVEDWFRIKDAPNAPSKEAFARQKQVKPDTFCKYYVHNDPDKRRKLGRHAGRPSLLSECNSQFVMEHTIRADRANNGLTPAQIIENMSTLQPELSQLQSKNIITACSSRSMPTG
jgi:hypothetical protein